MYFPIVTLLSLVLPSLVLAQSKVNVTVYYESLCPDSQKFFNNQLYKAYISPLVMYMNLTLIPYGNAETLGNGTFKCQHGSTECYGNMIQACAIQKIENSDKRLAYINCLMQMAFDKKPHNDTAYDSIIQACSNWTDQQVFIDQCSHSPDGINLMYRYGNLTKSANPSISGMGVPTISFNQQSSTTINNNASTNFVDELCKYISKPKPKECGDKSTASSIANSIALVISAIIISRYSF